MKMHSISLAIAAGIFLSGCASGKNGLALDIVGPIPTATAAVNRDSGTLIVYSDYEVNADFNSRDSYRPEYSDYKIYNAAGNLQERVHNDSGTILQDPTPVKLPVGKYRVVARANGYGYVTIPVLIEAQQSTILHLEGGGGWSDKSKFNQTNAVRLPDGRIIGWRASANS